MKAKEKVYNILISIDDGYVDRAIETIMSFINHNDAFFNVYLLYEDLKKETLNKLERFLSDSKSGKLIPIKTDLSNVNLPINISYISKVTYYRLFAPYFINEERVLYIDCDIICNGSIDDFYNMDFEGSAIISCPNMLDSSKQFLDSVMKSNIDISLDDVYINAGVLLINIDVYRNFISMESLIDFINNTKLLLEFQDQDVINHVFHNVIKLASNDYNFQMNGVDSGSENFNAPIIHFSEYYKPWNDDYFDTRKASSYYDFLFKNNMKERAYELIDKHLLNGSSFLDDISVSKQDSVDIIIPVYNAKDSLSNCLSSIQNQKDVPKLKVYIIDDASTESYDDILKDYKKLDIKYVKLDKNSGPGVARNKGLEESSSKYVIFIDSDDVFSSNHSISILYKLIKKDDVDMVRTTIYRPLKDNYLLYSYDEFGLHGKIYKREFIDRYKLKFNKTYFFEDTGFNLLFNFFAANISDYDFLTYLWNNSDNSLTNKKKVNYVSLAQNIADNYKLYLKNSDKDRYYINYFISLKWMDFVNKNINKKDDYKKVIKAGLDFFSAFKNEYSGIYYDDLYQYIANRYQFHDIIKFIGDIVLEYVEKYGANNLTEFEKSLIGLPYFPLDFECQIEQKIYPQLIDKYNKNYYSNPSSVVDILPRAFYKFGYGAKILPPINSNWGCKNVSIGNATFINSNVTFVDDADIVLGDGVLVGPNVTFCTSSHSVQLENRNKIIAKPIIVGNNVWIGAGAIILQGVKIGDNSVVGAGSVVTKDIPANKVAFGNPCKVQKSID